VATACLTIVIPESNRLIITVVLSLPSFLIGNHVLWHDLNVVNSWTVARTDRQCLLIECQDHWRRAVWSCRRRNLRSHWAARSEIHRSDLRSCQIHALNQHLTFRPQSKATVRRVVRVMLLIAQMQISSWLTVNQQDRCDAGAGVVRWQHCEISACGMRNCFSSVVFSDLQSPASSSNQISEQTQTL